MSITFQQSADQTADHNSAGSLLLGALFGGLTSEAGQMIDNVADAAEVASEFHTHYQAKADQKKSFELGQKNSIGGAFTRGVSNMLEAKPDIQKRYLNFDYRPQRGMGMAMAA
jgi:hypothetical protein